jgi:hypothetical protein
VKKPSKVRYKKEQAKRHRRWDTQNGEGFLIGYKNINGI